jgi:hypothetical protein
MGTKQQAKAEELALSRALRELAESYPDHYAAILAYHRSKLGVSRLSSRDLPREGTRAS